MTESNPYEIDKRLLRQSFARAAATYDESAVLQKEISKRVLERLQYISIKPQVVLDVGAGTGFAAKALLKQYPGSRVIAADIATPMLQKTRKRCGWLRRPSLLCADIEALPLADASVDVIFTTSTLQWCNDLDNTLHHFKRILKPGGLLMLSSFGPDTLKELRASWATVDQHTHVNTFMDMHDIGDGLLRAGFAEPVMDMEIMNITYHQVTALLRDLKNIGAQNKTRGRSKGLTGKGQIKHMQTAYEAFRNTAGLLPATYEVVYGHAWAPALTPAQKTEIAIPIHGISRKTPKS